MVAAVTDATFADDVLKSTKPVLVDYWADWCTPCKQIAPIIEELDREYGLADVMDGDEQSRLPSHERKSVGSAEIFRPAGAKVHALPPGEIQCHVGTANEVCAENGDDVGKHSRPLSAEDPRENLVFLSNQEILNLFYITRKRRRCQALVFRRTSCAACA